MLWMAFPKQALTRSTTHRQAQIQAISCAFIGQTSTITVTYDHRLRRIGHPVRSAIHKLQIGRLVVGWVTTSEYLLLYVFFFAFGVQYDE